MSDRPPILQYTLGSWQVVQYETVDSTNLVARNFSPWHAVVAEHQSEGRGRHGRSWHSEVGGLWVTAVLPALALPESSKFSLAIGSALVQWLRGLEIAHARLRWPNDLMIHDHKLGGLLLNHYPPEKLLVGLGLNIRNSLPVLEQDAANPITLSQVLQHTIEPGQVLKDVLASVEQAYHHFCTQAGLSLLPVGIWGPPRKVRLLLVGNQKVEGKFVGINQQGDPLIEFQNAVHAIPSEQVLRLLEL